MTIPGNVQQKISCIFKTMVCNENSSKRTWQNFRVVASEEMREEALNLIDTALFTEKIDGTCCYIQLFRGEPWLWARHDRRPTKLAEKKFNKFINQQMKKKCDVTRANYQWDVQKDFKDVPADWIPASGIEIDASGNLIPNSIGHIPGWVPVDPSSRTHLWHLSVVDFSQGLALVLRPDSTKQDILKLSLRPLSEMIGQTAELIGTNINGNPYGLGSKKNPIHMLVPHGILGFNSPVPQNITDIKEWFNSSDGQVEGIVWHCQNGQLFKLHRYHVQLPWPVPEPHLAKRTINIQMDSHFTCEDSGSLQLFNQLQMLSGHTNICMKNLESLLEVNLRPEK